jgi:hypothetical protein
VLVHVCAFVVDEYFFLLKKRNYAFALIFGKKLLLNFLCAFVFLEKFKVEERKFGVHKKYPTVC